MARLLSAFPLFGILLCLSGCLATPVANTGGPGSITVPNTNAWAIATAARNVFANYGYTPGPGSFPNSLSFERSAGSFGRLMFGSYGTTTTFRVRVQMNAIPGTSDIRLVPRVSRVTNAGEAGFESDTKMMSLWAGQFGPILRDIKNQAANAGPGF